MFNTAVLTKIQDSHHYHTWFAAFLLEVLGLAVQFHIDPS